MTRVGPANRGHDLKVDVESSTVRSSERAAWLSLAPRSDDECTSIMSVALCSCGLLYPIDDDTNTLSIHCLFSWTECKEGSALMERENVGRDGGPTSNFVPVKAGSTASEGAGAPAIG